jgi:hypothetical protein
MGNAEVNTKLNLECRLENGPFERHLFYVQGRGGGKKQAYIIPMSGYFLTFIF